MSFRVRRRCGNCTLGTVSGAHAGVTVFANKEIPMIKVAAKPARVAAPQGRILYCENDAAVLKAQSKTFERAGYMVEAVIGRTGAQQALHGAHYDVVVLGHTLTKDDRHHLPYMAKKTDRDVQVLVLHASGKHPAVDWAMDSRDGDEAVMSALRSLAEEKKFAVAS
jgi:CheY-like chemotaxis protein